MIEVACPHAKGKLSNVARSAFTLIALACVALTLAGGASSHEVTSTGCVLPARLAMFGDQGRCVKPGAHCLAKDKLAYTRVGLQCTRGRLRMKAAAPQPKMPPSVGSTSALPVPLGKPGSLGNGWTLTITGVNFDATAVMVAADPTNQPPFPGFQYVLISVTATYAGQDAASSHLSPMTSFRASGASGFLYSPSNAYCGLLPPPNLDRDNPLVYRGGTITGNASCWMVRSSDVGSLVMTYQPLSTGVPVWFALR